jgi:hypothetical protein
VIKTLLYFCCTNNQKSAFLQDANTALEHRQKDNTDIEIPLQYYKCRRHRHHCCHYHHHHHYYHTCFNHKLLCILPKCNAFQPPPAEKIGGSNYCIRSSNIVATLVLAVVVLIAAAAAPTKVGR